MSLDNTLSGIQSLTNTVSSATGIVTRTAADLGMGLGGRGQYWKDALQKASYNGIPFGVLGGEGSFGRKNVVHTYPFRDSVWVEDLGRSARRISVNGFLVGGDCIAQRDELIKAFEEEGECELVLPTYGAMTVDQTSQLHVREAWDKGRMFEISFSCIEAGDQQFPNTGDSTGNVVTSAASAADSASASDFIKNAADALKVGAAAVNQAVSMAAKFGRLAQRLANDAANLSNMVNTLSGDFSRFFGGRNNGIKKKATATSTATVASLIAKGSSSRSSVSSASSALSSSAGNPEETAIAAQVIAAAVLNSSVDPADGIRLLSDLSGFSMPTVSLSSPIGVAVKTVQNATADLFRRAAVVAMARASATYQPYSADDAASLRARICDALDEEIQIAGDQGEDDTFNTLRTLRAAVAKDLTERGAGLPSIVTIQVGRPMPSLALAQRLYRDSGRSDELITQADCIHPAFMPTSFKALSK